MEDLDTKRRTLHIFSNNGECADTLSKISMTGAEFQEDLPFPPPTTLHNQV